MYARIINSKERDVSLPQSQDPIVSAGIGRRGLPPEEAWPDVQGAWPERSRKRESVPAHAGVTGRSGSRERAGAARLSPLPHTKPRRGENGGRGRSGSRSSGDRAQNGGRERRALRAERQRSSGPEGVSTATAIYPSLTPAGLLRSSVRSVGGFLFSHGGAAYAQAFSLPRVGGGRGCDDDEARRASRIAPCRQRSPPPPQPPGCLRASSRPQACGLVF